MRLSVLIRHGLPGGGHILYLPPAAVSVFLFERGQIYALFQSHSQIDLSGIMSPGPEPHVAVLPVKREVNHIHRAGALKDGVRKPADVSGVCDNREGVTIGDLHVSTVNINTRRFQRQDVI